MTPVFRGNTAGVDLKGEESLPLRKSLGLESSFGACGEKTAKLFRLRKVLCQLFQASYLPQQGILAPGIRLSEVTKQWE